MLIRKRNLPKLEAKEERIRHRSMKIQNIYINLLNLVGAIVLFIALLVIGQTFLDFSYQTTDTILLFITTPIVEISWLGRTVRNELVAIIAGLISVSLRLTLYYWVISIIRKTKLAVVVKQDTRVKKAKVVEDKE